MDLRVHNLGPYDVRGIKQIDKEIQKTLNLYNSWEEAVKKNIWIVMGDNGQSITTWSFKDVEINLNHLLSDYKIHSINKPVQDDDELVIAVNQRMAYIYLLNDRLSIDRLAYTLRQDSRIDVMAWKEDEHIKVVSGLHSDELKFSRGGEVRDEYYQYWTISGNPEILDLKIKQDIIEYRDFPDALARLYGALNSHQGRFLVVNAKPGCEFLAKKTPVHIGGACHGSLHKEDSITPLIVAGTKELPKFNRLVDMKGYIFTLLNS
ncbi:hypothetical protein [Piscibacillus halophilus]|uniref:Type I phosphodiesterase / nucleotide pyrophosphatase n=1 Tax=Piscibacillus halophilus TaxID=571933 RepID=A0A1H8ZK24_9BACI|nr:hypothetical protein [Piscibacillus halophilus]SEP64613.1 hypothetical protein SAMN05216362_1025 [Piscibacillus halophilus]